MKFFVFAGSWWCKSCSLSSLLDWWPQGWDRNFGFWLDQGTVITFFLLNFYFFGQNKAQLFIRQGTYYNSPDWDTCGHRRVWQQVLPQPGLLQGQGQVKIKFSTNNLTRLISDGWSTIPSMVWTMMLPWFLPHGLDGCTTRRIKLLWRRSRNFINWNIHLMKIMDVSL